MVTAGKGCASPTEPRKSVDHRGHAVFDTANLVDGSVYQLEAHLTRLLRSAQLSGLEPPFTLQQMYRTVLETAAASCKANGAPGRDAVAVASKR